MDYKKLEKEIENCEEKVKNDENYLVTEKGFFEENEETPFAIAYKKANGEVVFYYPE